MKILISESQLSNLIEQSQNWEKEKQKYVTDYERRELQKVDNQVAIQNKVGKVIKKLGPNLDADDYADIVSGLIDVIPGIGNLVSGGIDITHGITYLVRAFYANAIEDKVEMWVMALITLGTAFIPVGGNAANVVARGEIKMLLRKTPYEILKIGKDLGIIKGAIFNLSKQAWKYSILIALVKVFRSSLDNVFGEVSRVLATIGNKSEELKPIMDTYIKEIKGLQEIKRTEMV
jgi:hypothetical protein